MVAGQRALLPRTRLVHGGRGRDDPRHVDVRQAVREVVDVDVDAVARNLALDAVVLWPLNGEEEALSLTLTHTYISIVHLSEDEKGQLERSTYSCSELINTLEVYSSSSDVLERTNAARFGLEKANAVPRGLWESAPMPRRNHNTHGERLTN